MGVYEENTTESKVGNKKTGVMKMKKLMVAILVLASVFAYAKKDNNTEVGPVQFDAENHVFNVMESGTWEIQLNSSTTVNGQVHEFGYSVQHLNGVTSDPIPFTTDELVLPDLSKGDKIVFYVVTEQNGQNGSAKPLTEFSIIPTPGNSAHGHVVYGVKWPNNNNLSFYGAKFEPAPSAPSGQPLPGALTTMLVAGGCAALLRKRKAARK